MIYINIISNLNNPFQLSENGPIASTLQSSSICCLAAGEASSPHLSRINLIPSSWWRTFRCLIPYGTFSANSSSHLGIMLFGQPKVSFEYLQRSLNFIISSYYINQTPIHLISIPFNLPFLKFSTLNKSFPNFSSKKDDYTIHLSYHEN